MNETERLDWLASGDVDLRVYLAENPTIEPELRGFVEGLLDDEVAFAGLSGPALPVDFYDTVMEQIPLKPRSWSWLARAAAAALTFVAGAGAALAMTSGTEPVPLVSQADDCSEVAPAHTEPIATTAPEVRGPLPSSALSSVRFLYVGEPGQTVQIVGGFNGWGERAMPLVPTALPGIYQATVALPQGEHEYMFVIDGDRFVADPLADRFRADSFGRENSVLLI
jgi:hypothetical protein